MSGREFSILGAGLAGSLAAIYLTRRGHDVTVYERRPDPRVRNPDGGRSINLALANRGIRALEQVGLLEDIRKLIIPMRGRMLHEPGQEPTLQPYGKDESEVIFSVSRAGLNELLLNRAEDAGARVRFEHAVEDIDLDSGSVTIARDGQTTRLTDAGAIIGADGSGSPLRRALTALPGSHTSEEFSAHGYKELTIPPGAGGEFRIDPNALHVWPRSEFMMIALPNQDPSFTATLFLAHTGEHSFAKLQTSAQVRTFFDTHFPDAIPLLPTLEQEFAANPVGRMVTVRCEPWHADGRALLIGDAAHAIVPFHGQGMNCAFEDCFELGRCLDELGSDDLAAVFRLFERRRRPNANAIADMAIENYHEMRAAVRDPHFHLKKTLAFELEKRWPAQFIPRYSMVMFHHIPYAEAQRRGRIQQSILDELLRAAPDDDPMAAIDYALAGRLIGERLTDAQP